VRVSGDGDGEGGAHRRVREGERPQRGRRRKPWREWRSPKEMEEEIGMQAAQQQVRLAPPIVSSRLQGTVARAMAVSHLAGLGSNDLCASVLGTLREGVDHVR